MLFGSLNTRKMNNIVKVSNYSQHESYVKRHDTVCKFPNAFTLFLVNEYGSVL